MFLWIALLIAAPFVAAVLVLLAVTWIERRQAHRLKDLHLRAPTATRESGTAVVYFSRSGNTALAARHVAARLDAPLFELHAPAYRLGLRGLSRALRDANELKSHPEALPDITSRPVDLRPFTTVWLGSPVWLYSPAPPVWAFVEHSRFDGQRVVLFNTFNSHIGDDHIAALRAKVMARGARSFEHLHVLRGRMTRQLTPDDMLEAIDARWFGSPARP
jgi:hypothetical protein